MPNSRSWYTYSQMDCYLESDEQKLQKLRDQLDAQFIAAFCCGSDEKLDDELFGGLEPCDIERDMEIDSDDS